MTEETKRMWDLHDKIERLKVKKDLAGSLTAEEDIELRNMQQKFWGLWNKKGEWK